VHLLPSFQFGGVDDNAVNWKHPGKETAITSYFQTNILLRRHKFIETLWGSSG
jgi:hypothetical protein